MKLQIKLRMMALFMSFILITSCVQEEPSPQTTPAQSPIEKMLGEFKSSVTPPTRQAETLNIVSVDTKYYTTDDNDSIVETVSTRTENDGIFDVSTVTLRVGDNYGYALLSTHPKINRIFYYTENGALSDTTFLTPLKDIIDNIPYFAHQDLISEAPITRATQGEIVIQPIVPYQWDQGTPFNLFTIACSCAKCNTTEHGGHRPVGCIAVAVAQAIATMGIFPGTFYGNKDISFSDLPKSYKEVTNNNKLQVARFLHEIALQCQIKFGCDESLGYPKAAYNHLTDLGYTCYYYEGELVPGRVLTPLTKGCPQIVAAQTSKGQGHVWLIDGVKVKDSKFQYHFNWGWAGQSDGWSYGDTFQSKDEGNNESDKYVKGFKYVHIFSKPNN